VPDDAAPARGLCLGCLISGLLWALVFGIAWFVLPGVW